MHTPLKNISTLILTYTELETQRPMDGFLVLDNIIHQAGLGLGQNQPRFLSYIFRMNLII